MTDTSTPQVVFACVRNGGRSVISRVLTEHYAGGRVIAGRYPEAAASRLYRREAGGFSPAADHRLDRVDLGLTRPPLRVSARP